MNKILVPVDFSEYATTAFHYAYQLAGYLNASLDLFHSFPLNARNPFQSVEMILSLEHKAESEARLKLNTYVQDCLNKFDPDRKSKVMVNESYKLGLAVENILSLVEHQNYDLVVMGTRGAGNVTSKLLGTNTACVIENINKPVLAIPVNALFKPLQKIILATDLQNFVFSDVSVVSELAIAFNAEIQLLHIVSEKNTTSDSIREKYLERAIARLNYQNISMEIIEDHDVEHGISRFQDTHQADLLAMTVHHRSSFQKIFNPSLTKHVSYSTHVPLLALHSK